MFHQSVESIRGDRYGRAQIKRIDPFTAGYIEEFTGLYAAMPVPLRWAEEGQVVRIVPGRVISLEDIITYYRMGYTAEMIACDTYPWLGLADIYLVIAFYLAEQVKSAVHAHLRENIGVGGRGMGKDGGRQWDHVSEESYKAYCESRSGTEWY